MNTDPIADMLTRIRNANGKLMEKVDIPSSKIKIEIAKVLKEEGYIANFKNIEDHKQGILRVYLKYTSEGKQTLLGLKRISKPGLRIYRGVKEIPKVTGGMGIAIVSTPKGVMSDKRARQEKTGGEIIAYAW
ncbi:MAG: 30S ribosomal protein S8 [Endomicrobiales bacterium]|nr:30S ribosomal protein S8 [Endomicrobiales bacterium]